MQTPPCVPGEQSRWRSLLLFSVKWLSPMDYCNQVSVKKIKSKFFWVVRMLILLTFGTKDMTFANRTHGANSVFWEDDIVKVLLEYLICLYANYVFCHFHLLDDFVNFFYIFHPAWNCYWVRQVHAVFFYCYGSHGEWVMFLLFVAVQVSLYSFLQLQCTHMIFIYLQ